MVIRRLLRVALLGAATVACGAAAYAPTPTALVGEYSVQAGTGFGTYDIALALEAVADSVHGRWRLAWQATCATEDGLIAGTLVGGRLLCACSLIKPGKAPMPWGSASSGAIAHCPGPSEPRRPTARPSASFSKGQP